MGLAAYLVSVNLVLNILQSRCAYPIFNYNICIKYLVSTDNYIWSIICNHMYVLGLAYPEIANRYSPPWKVCDLAGYSPTEHKQLSCDGK